MTNLSTRKHAHCAAVAALLYGCATEPIESASATDTDTASTGDVEPNGAPPRRRPLGPLPGAPDPLPPATDTDAPENETISDDSTDSTGSEGIWSPKGAECLVPGDLEPGWPASCHVRAPQHWAPDYRCCRTVDDCPPLGGDAVARCDAGVCSGCEER